MTDMDHWGVVEKWSYPDDGKGDCEDYVLLKRRMLMQAGWPREALLITVVRDKKGDGHAVLTVKTDKGDFILDNQEETSLLWSETGYRFVKRQSQSNPNAGSRSAIRARHRHRHLARADNRSSRPGHVPTPARVPLATWVDQVTTVIDQAGNVVATTKTVVKAAPEGANVLSLSIASGSMRRHEAFEDGLRHLSGLHSGALVSERGETRGVSGCWSQHATHHSGG